MDYNYEVISSAAALRDAIGRLVQSPILALDTETTGLNPFRDELLLLQVATPEQVYVIDTRAVDIKPLQAILEDPKIVKILQNAKFDLKFLKQRYGITLVNLWDTMLAESVLKTGLAAVSLEAIAHRHLGLALDKSVRSSFHANGGGPTLQQVEYAAEDAAVLLPIYEQQQVKLEHESLTPVAKLEFETVTAIVEMELAGLEVDADKWQVFIRDHEARLNQAKRELLGMLQPAIPQLSFLDDVSTLNLDSPKQVIQALAQVGILVKDTSEPTLMQLNHPVARKLLEYREHQKILTTYGVNVLKLIEPATGRLHPDFQQIGAGTGRLSCQNPNVQQIPTNLRGCFVAQPGYKIVQCDYAQCELRILAQLSRDPVLCEAFRSGGDLHSITASRIFKVPLRDVTATQRHQAKTINFALMYGEGPTALAAQLGISDNQASLLIQGYFRTFSQVRWWLEKAARDALMNGYSTTLLGRKRYFEIPDSDDPDFKRKISLIKRQGKNSPIQGSNADMVKLALVQLYQQLRGYDACIVNVVHDEIVVEAREDQSEDVLKILERAMISAGETFITAVPVKVEGKIGDCWQK